jgi:hypothetical protein
MQSASRECESLKPVTFVPASVGFDDRGDLTVKAYFVNSGPERVAVISLHLEVYSLANRLSPLPVASESYNGLEVVLPPGAAVERSFSFAAVDRAPLEHWRVSSRYSWQAAD